MKDERRVLMKEIAPKKRLHNFEPFRLGYTKQEAIKEAQRCLNCKNPRCVLNCPIHNRIPEFIQRVKEDKLLEAYSILMNKTVLPEICGTICPHEKQCEGACVRGIKGESVNIGAIERYIAKYMRLENKDETTFQKHLDIHVALIGSGPASLACALYLAQNGAKVSIYEKESYLGGVLRWGIPGYRLDKEVLKHLLKRLEKLGVEFILDHEVQDLNELKDHDAIFIGSGALKPNRLNIEGEDLDGIYQAKDFLKETNFKHKLERTFKNIMVVGGGNVAMDAARNALRLEGVKNVTIVYRRSLEEMPACKEELDDALLEGVTFLPLTNPYKLIGQDRLEKVILQKMTLGEPDDSGRRRPLPLDEYIEYEVDALILALGFKANDNTFGLKTDDRGLIKVNDQMESSRPLVFVGGDAQRGPMTVVLAMKDGIKAAKEILGKLL